MNEILDKVLNTDYRLSLKDAQKLFECSDNQSLKLIKEYSDELRKRTNGDKVSYIHNLNVNFTNICDSVCLFCGFRASESDQNSYVISLDKFEQDIEQAKKEGIQEICLQGGLYSKLQIPGLRSATLLDMYAELLIWVKERFEYVHIHAYSPEEIDFLSVLSGKSHRYILEYFKDSGLESMPGTAAEILDDEVRKKICSKKLNTQTWVDVISMAHKVGIPSTATILFGHVENSYHRAKHLEVLRNIQDNTNGFTEFIPLAFISDKTLLSGKVTPLNSTERLKMLAISRLFFKDSINNIQASWVKQGLQETAESLDWGVNDIGGTLGDERITAAAGGNFGRSMTKEELVDLIESKGRTAVQRDTLYQYIDKEVSQVL